MVEVFNGDAAVVLVVPECHDADVVVGRGLLHHGRDIEVAAAVDDAVVNLKRTFEVQYQVKDYKECAVRRDTVIMKQAEASRGRGFSVESSPDSRKVY